MDDDATAAEENKAAAVTDTAMARLSRTIQQRGPGWENFETLTRGPEEPVWGPGRRGPEESTLESPVICMANVWEMTGDGTITAERN